VAIGRSASIGGWLLARRGGRGKIVVDAAIPFARWCCTPVVTGLSAAASFGGAAWSARG